MFKVTPIHTHTHTHTHTTIRLDILVLCRESWPTILPLIKVSSSSHIQCGLIEILD